MSVLEVQGVSLSYGGVDALREVDVEVAAGEVHAIIGPNGAGKTSLLNVCSGITSADSGVVRVCGRDVGGWAPSSISRAGLARTFQNLQLFPHATTLDNVLVGATAQQDVPVLRSLLGGSRTRDAERSARERAHACLDLVGLADRAADRAGALPYGNQRLLEIARAMATEPTVLLLDEPGAGFNAEEKRGLAQLLGRIRSSGTAVVIVEHDMPLVMGVSDVVTVIHFGERIARGTPEQVSNDPAVIDAYLGADDEEAT